MQELQIIQPEQVPVTAIAAQWVNSDVDVETNAAITDEDIIQEYQNTDDANANSDEDSDDTQLQECQAFRLKVPDHLSNQQNGCRKWAWAGLDHP